jgi:D-alanyl-D-alanine carboxypeptidase
MNLFEKQVKFASMVPALIAHAYALGYQVTIGDAYRDARVFGEVGVRKGYGESRSLHKVRLAIDLNLFHDGKYLPLTSDHEPLGLWWEAQGGTWGGRFNDGNHYSLEHDGMK